MTYPTSISGSASARNHFPQTVALLRLRAARAVLLDQCRQMLAAGAPREEVKALLDSVLAEMLAMAKECGK